MGNRLEQLRNALTDAGRRASVAGNGEAALRFTEAVIACEAWGETHNGSPALAERPDYVRRLEGLVRKLAALEPAIGPAFSHQNDLIADAQDLLNV